MNASSNAQEIAASTLAAAHLRDLMHGKVLLAEEPGFDAACQLWNGGVRHRPAVLALCENVRDVQAAVQVAQRHHLRLSVRGGGHDWAGRALAQGGLVVDLTRMRQVEIDPVAKTATVGGGATAADLMAAADPHGLATVTANVGAVGLAGFLVAGGYGPLTTRFGLGVDNLLGAEVVLADGRMVQADAHQNPDLFWALRGGGGNFGVVTAMHLRLHPVGELLAGFLFFPWDQAETVLRGHADLIAAAPDELSVLSGLIPTPEGEPVVFLGPIWSGDKECGASWIRRWQNLGTPLLNWIVPMSYRQLLSQYDAQVVKGRHYALKTLWLADLTPEILAAIAAAGSARTSSLSLIAMHHFHGPGTTVAPDATAFGLRRPHFLLEIVAVWEPGDAENEALHRAWVERLHAALKPHALPGGYPNFLTQDDHKQIGAAYGGNAARLRSLKKKYDPTNVFSSAVPLPL